MSLTLSSMLIPTFRQTLGAIDGVLGKAEAHCADTGRAPAELIEARLAPDMLPLAWQVKFVVAHSLGALLAVREGVFSPERSPPPSDFTGLRALIADARAEVDAVDAAEVDASAGRDMRFQAGDFRLDFTVEDYLLSFALPNFYFHASTAYGILRHAGVGLSKFDFMGAARFKS